ncbi:unnamed protein product [Caenorhabditis sp. 36 PRJEB53466]|nr:unnamed protein product [Caenorhabditis sp. 36 PRJEB53466]
MPKRGCNQSANEEDKVPIVEKLYRENQDSDYLGGGFCDDDDEVQERREQISEMRQKRADAVYSGTKAPDNCEKCEKVLMDSWLWERYNCPVCDSCRDEKGEHKLLARTEVKNAYLLKDCDLDLRKPPLRFWAKKNPHNPRYGDMKLYLKCQVEERVLEVHGSWEDLELKKELREQSKEVRSEKRFEKKLKDLRQQIKGTSGVKIEFVSIEEGILPRQGQEPPAVAPRKSRPEKLFLRSASVGLAPGDGEQSPSPGPTTKTVEDKKQNRRESIKGHLMKFKAKAGKILEEKQGNKLTPEDQQNSGSFLSQTESELKEEFSVLDEQGVSESSIQQEVSKKESKEQLRNRIRQSAQKAVERTRGNVQLNRRLARRPTVVMEEHLDKNDLTAIDEQVEKTIKMGEKYLVANETTIAAERDIEEFFEPKAIDTDDTKKAESRKMVYGRVEGVKYDHDLMVRYVARDGNIVCGETIPKEILKNVKKPPTRVEYCEDSVSYYTAPETMEDVASRMRSRKFVQMDVFVDSIHFDHHYLWGEEEVATAELRNAFMMQLLRVHELAQLARHHLDEDRQPVMKEEVRKGRTEIERLADVLNETRRSQGYTATKVSFVPAENPWDDDDWQAYGKMNSAAKLTPVGKIPKETRERIAMMRKTNVQLVLYFNDMEVSRTAWVPLSADIMVAVKRFELELYSPMKSLTLMVLEQSNGKIRVLGKGNVPLPSEDDLDVALHEVVFECDTPMKPIGGSFGSESERKENGRILCRAMLEDGELRLADDRLIAEAVQDRRRNKFELIPSELVLGSLDQEDAKKRLEELREEDRAQKRFTYRSAIDSRRISAIQFANLARKRVMDRRQKKEKKYEEIVREQSIPTLSVAFSQLFGPADVSRKLKPMRREERAKKEGWDSTVVVNIQSAVNLPVRLAGMLQPFVVVRYSGKTVATDVAVGRHPNWQFTAKMKVDKEDRNEEFIEIRVYDQLVEGIEKDDRIRNVIHEQLSVRLLASQKIRFETLASVSKISTSIRLHTPLYISNYKISPDSCFLKVLLSTQIEPKSQVEYTRSPSSFETQRTLEKCADLERQLRELFPKRTFRSLVTDLNAHSTICTRFLRPLKPPAIVMQENSTNLEGICQLAGKIVSGIPRVDATSHSDIWGTAFQLTSIAVGGLEERATLLGCWLLHFKMPVAIVLGEAQGEKTGFVLTEFDGKQMLIDPEDGHIYPTTDVNCGLQKIFGAFDTKNYYANVQEYDQTPQIVLNLTKASHWKPLFTATDEPLESVQPAVVQYAKVSEDWIVELRVALEREIKLRFDEARKFAIPQWHLVAARQLREALENSRGNLEATVAEKMSRLKDGYAITVVIFRMHYSSIQDCVHEVLSNRLHDCSEQTAQFALAVHVVDFFAHAIQVDVALALLKSKK